MITILYCCPVCGCHWEQSLSQTETVITPECQCPSCEEPVSGVLSR